MGKGSIFSVFKFILFSVITFNFNFKKSKKSIGPVVATALLLVIAVGSVTMFQGWFQTYQSSMFTGVEQQSAIGSGISVEGLIDSILYLKSGTDTNLTTLKVTDGNGNEMCSFSDSTDVNSSGELLHWSFKNLTYNGSNYFVPDISGNGNNGLVLSENRNSNNNYFTALSGSNETFINFSFNYKRNNSGTLNGCYIKYNNQYSKILNQTDVDPTSWYGQNVYLETPLIGMTTNEKFSFICNQSNFYNVNGSITFDGLDDFIFLENSEDFVENNLEYNDNYTIILKGESKNNGDMFHTRKNCGVENQLDLNLNSADVGSTYPNRSNLVSNFKRNSALVSFRNSYSGVNSSIFFSQNNYIISNTTNSTDYNSYGNLLALGKSIGCGNRDLIGTISDFRIYNRTLSDSEIKTLYWYSIKQQQKGINQIDLSSCNLNKGNVYNVVAFTKNQKVEHTLVAK